MCTAIKFSIFLKPEVSGIQIMGSVKIIIQFNFNSIQFNIIQHVYQIEPNNIIVEQINQK